MIPELQRALPAGVFGPAIAAWSRVATTRCLRKYGPPRPDDVVCDVGGYHGEFAIPAAMRADRVYAIEPDAEAARYLSRATADIPSVLVDTVGIAPTDGPYVFQSSPATADTTLEHIGTDATPGGRQEVECRRLDSYRWIDAVDYLKVDAEGAEPEVLTSLGTARPRTIRVDVTPERDGRSPRPAVREWLADAGYRVHDRSEAVLRGDYAGGADV